MSSIHLTTFIAAPVSSVFDLARSVDMHKQSMKNHKEEAVAGIRFGLIEKNESVTWKAKHFFKTRFFTSRVIEMKPFEKFTDKMIRGDFVSFQHEHFFKPADNGSIVIDIISYEPPFGILGKMMSRLYLTPYIEKLVVNRNKVIRQYAESEKWKAVLQTRF